MAITTTNATVARRDIGDLTSENAPCEAAREAINARVIYTSKDTYHTIAKSDNSTNNKDRGYGRRAGLPIERYALVMISIGIRMYNCQARNENAGSDKTDNISERQANAVKIRPHLLELVRNVRKDSAIKSMVVVFWKTLKSDYLKYRYGIFFR